MNGINTKNIPSTNNTSGKKRCTQTNCLGPHSAAKCFAKPENAAAKKAFFDRFKKTSANNTKSKNSETNPSTAEKPDVNPSANNTDVKKIIWAFITYCAKANLVDSIRKVVWDTGASQNMFQSPMFFL